MDVKPPNENVPTLIKTCSRCKKAHQEKTKHCSSCKAKSRQRGQKRRRDAKVVIPPPGHQHCHQCYKTKPLDQFNLNQDRDGRSWHTTHCTACLDKVKKSTEKSYIRVELKRLYTAFIGKDCQLCGLHPARNADHIDPTSKVRALSAIHHWMSSGIDAWLSEANKCQALCILCHRKKTGDEHRKVPKTAKQVNAARHNAKGKAFIAHQKILVGKCFCCGLVCSSDNVKMFDWDHRDPLSKRFKVSALAERSKTRIIKEIALCQLVCSSCHAKRTKDQRVEGELPRARKRSRIAS